MAKDRAVVNFLEMMFGNSSVNLPIGKSRTEAYWSCRELAKLSLLLWIRLTKYTSREE